MLIIINYIISFWNLICNNIFKLKNNKYNIIYINYNMHFCDKCGNMFYLKISEEVDSQLLYYCRKCGNKSNDKVDGESNELCVSKTHIKKTTQSYKNIINSYTKLDPTLPRLTNMKCPNPQCTIKASDNSDGVGGESKGGEESKEIIYIRYDNDNMKYIYLCTNCDYHWINN